MYGLMPVPAGPPCCTAREYRAYWFFLNLQLALDRSILGALLGNGSHPMPLDITIKPFPWPSREEDLGAASAAAFLNLLLVYAFLAPTRAVVGSIVREKELRLKEGMRILGLSVSLRMARDGLAALGGYGRGLPAGWSPCRLRRNVSGGRSGGERSCVLGEFEGACVRVTRGVHCSLTVY
jgi:hypothetical protein